MSPVSTSSWNATSLSDAWISPAICQGLCKAQIYVFLAVGTPMRRGDGYADLSYVFEALRDIAPYLDESTIVATKSTVPVGTSREIKRQLGELRRDLDIVVCSNPEFLREGSAIRDFTHPDRVLIGCEVRSAQRGIRRFQPPSRRQENI